MACRLTWTVPPTVEALPSRDARVAAISEAVTTNWDTLLDREVNAKCPVAAPPCHSSLSGFLLLFLRNAPMVARDRG
jgi:hypothetical protein